MERLRRDLGDAVRSLWRRPAFSAAVVATLALGLGLNTAVFAVVEALLWRPLPGVHAPSELVQLYRAYPGERFGSLAVPDVVDLRERSGPFLDGVAGWTFATVSLTSQGEPRRVQGHLVSANYFEVLGVRPASGRVFGPADEQGEGAHPVVVLSHGGWQRLFGGEASVVGREIVVNGRAMQVVGVTPEGFRGALPALEPALFVPLMQLDQIRPAHAGALHARGQRFMNGIARLAPGVSVAQARDRLKTVMAELRRLHPDELESTEVNVVPQGEAGIHPSLRDAQAAMSFAVLSVVALLLLIACVNVANLLLSRAHERSREVAVRLAIGASRAHLVRMLLTESLLLAAIACGCGLLLAKAALRLAAGIAIPGVAFTPDFRLGPAVLGFALLLTGATALLAGLVPALQATRPALVAALKGEDAAGRRGARVSRLLVVAQAGLSLVLLVCSGLFLQSLRSAETMDKGFATDGRLVASVDPSLQGYPRSDTDAFYTRLEASLRGEPRVKSVAFTSVPPLGLNSTDRTLSVPGYTPRADERMSIHCASVTPAYFETLGIPLLRGRSFTAADTGEAPPVAVVNQRFAERYWPGQDALGRVVRIGRGRPRDFTVVGVVPTGKYRSLGERPLPFIYFAHAQEWTPGTTILIHADGAPEALAPALREHVRRIDPHLPLAGVASLEDSLGLALLPARVGGGVLAALGALGLALAAVGLYGVMASAVARRRREIGVRLALGAAPGRVAAQVIREGMGLVAKGAAIGLLGALGAAHALRGVLYGDAAHGPVFALVPAALLVVAALASGIPARRAAAVDPLAALRQD
jgi:predicted permease